MKPFLRFVYRGGSFCVVNLKENITLKEIADALRLIGGDFIRCEFYWRKL